MLFRKIQLIGITVIIGIAAVFALLKLLGAAPPAAASEPERVVAKTEDLWPSAKPTRDPDADLTFVAYYTDDFSIVLDLSSMPLGEWPHFGEVKCNGDNCNKTTTVILNGTEYEYMYSSRQAIDPESDRVLVVGTGIVTTDTLKTRFSFTATFEDNRDGTIKTTYFASVPEASFILPNAPGTFEIRSRR
jgi:hypothetical protein